jgi:hypothetical protein
MTSSELSGVFDFFTENQKLFKFCHTEMLQWSELELTVKLTFKEKKT